MMGLPKKPTLSCTPTSPYIPADLHREGSSSNYQRNQAWVSDMHVHTEDATAQLSIMQPSVHIDVICNHISPCTSTTSQNKSCTAMIINTPDTPNKEKNSNTLNTWGVNDNHNTLSMAASSRQIPNHLSNTRNSAPQTKKRTNRQQINFAPHISRKRSWRQLAFAPHNETPRHDTRSGNNKNITTTIQLKDQQSVRASIRRSSNGPPIDYIHMGYYSCICCHCEAKFWECEKIANSGSRESAIYNKCCNGGQVVLRASPEYPPYIKNLFADPHFMENIRAYNPMFSMTSLGNKVDTSINNGRGPYVFRILGQIYHWIGSMCPQEGDMPWFLQLYIYDTNNEVQNQMVYFGGEEHSGLKREIVEGLIDFLDNHNDLVQLFRTARNKRADVNIPEFKLELADMTCQHQNPLEQ
nr:helitron helicase-like domain-containing protein [Tanacetum cinerariifolium]